MRLEGSCYNIVSSAPVEGGYVFDLVLAGDHPIYAGHFPGQPVVPGMCTLTVVRECLGKILARNVMFSSIKECKFLSALIPEGELSIVLRLMISDDDVSCVIEKDEAPVFKLKAKYTSL